MTEDVETLFLTRSDVAALASIGDHHRVAAEAFRAFEDGDVDAPPPMEIAGHSGAFHAKGAAMTIGSRRLVALKFNANFPDNAQRFKLPTIQGAILLSDAENGALLAIMDSAEITLRRTAAASAVALDALANPCAETLLFCGCGVQARAHAEAIAPLRRFKRAFCFDVDGGKAAAFAAEVSQAHGVDASTVDNLGVVAPTADVIVTTTTARTPFLEPNQVSAGAFIAAVGADSPAKNEIAPALMAKSLVVADVTSQAVSMGDTRAAIDAGTMTAASIGPTLGGVLSGACKGRRTADDIIIFDSTGAAFQDVAAAAMIFERAVAKRAGAAIRLGG